MDILNFVLEEEKTIRQFLEEYHVGKKKIYDLYIKKAILINNEFVSFDKVLDKGTKITVCLDLVEHIDVKPVKGKIDVIYEDNDILIINKPQGIIIHSDGDKSAVTLSSLVAGYYKERGINRCIRYVHRLDIDTTGLILFAKHFLASSMLDYELQNGEIERKYLAIVKGKCSKGKINKPIGKDRHINGKMICYDKGVDAVTYYKTVFLTKKYSLVECKLETGRTHQIRVHMSYMGYPLLGDSLYGGDISVIKRVALHSYFLALIHPMTKKSLSFQIDLPKDMEEVLNDEK